MALTDFFRINMPYGIRGNNEKGWFAFNRDYKPIGFNKSGWDNWVNYPDFPIYTKYRITKIFMEKLSDYGEREILKQGDEFMIYLYDDVTNPKNNNRFWSAYFEKIKMLSKLKRTDG